MKKILLTLICLSFCCSDIVAQATLPFSQDWTNTGLITTDDDWSGVPNITGYRGDGLTGSTGTDPQTITADETTIDVNANETTTGITTGGVAEFEITNPTIALQGSGTADAPFILISFATTSLTNIQVQYNLRELDDDNAVQQVALQYRIGNSGTFTNVPAGYVSDASNGSSLVTPVNVTLPVAVENQSEVQIRIITTNATGSDSWIGIDDISISGTPPTPIPTLSQWGTFLFFTTMLILGLISFYNVQLQNEPALQISNNKNVNLFKGGNLKVPFDRDAYVSCLKDSLKLSVLGFLFIFSVWGAIVLDDFIGMTFAIPLVAYLIFLLKK